MKIGFYNAFYQLYISKGYSPVEADAVAREEARRAEERVRQQRFQEARETKGRKIYKSVVKETGEWETLYDYLVYRGFDEAAARKIVNARGNLPMEKIEKEANAGKRLRRKIRR
jgi:SOS response regulatory protein OraA/RecX